MKEVDISSSRFIGLSGHLVSGAPGHFETFHKRLNQAVEDLIGRSNSQFLGSLKSIDKDSWFKPLIPRSMTSSVPWLSKKFLQHLREVDKKNGDVSILYIYEGNLASLFLLGSIARRSKGVYLYFNFFNSLRYSSIFVSQIKLILFKGLFLLALRGIHKKVQLSADTEKVSNLLESKLKKTFAVFPMYSGLSPEFITNVERNVTLINLRGVRSEYLLKSTLEKNPQLQNVVMDIHGIHNTEIALYLAKFSNITILPDQVDEVSYFASYKKYSRAAFLYDPEFFSMQSSGRLADAIVAGAEIVVPIGTSLEDVLLEFGNGSSFDFEKEDSLAHALLSKPSIKRKVERMPTSTWAATTILEKMQTLIEKDDTPEIHRVLKLLDYAIDEIIRSALWVLRLIFGFWKRLHILPRLKR